MGIVNPIKMCTFEFSTSNKLTKPLQSFLISQTGTLVIFEMNNIKNEIYHLKVSTTTSSLLEGAIVLV